MAGGRGVTVYLVGAGPGDPDLITVKGARLLARADVVVHDRLADPRLLRLVPDHARVVDVGKTPGSPVDQEAINELLVSEGRAGKEVVRLKGGDPFVFGRGGEEAEALAAAGVSFEVVPGITSAVAVPAYAGVPVTHRGLATSFTVVTGHSRHSVDSDTNWEALAAARGTIVVLMGVAHRAEIARRLIAGGLPADTPVLACRWGTRPEQQSVRVRLDQLGATALEPPATIVIGPVAELALEWYRTSPLAGVKVLVTRSGSGARALSEALEAQGATPLELPVTTIAEPSDGGAGLEEAARRLTEGIYDWVVFSSAQAAEALARRLVSQALGGARVAVVGPSTALAARQAGFEVHLEPPEASAAALAEVFPRSSARRKRVLFPRSAQGLPTIVEGLSRAGWTVDLVEAYQTLSAKADPSAPDKLILADAVCFSSPSAVQSFVEAFGPGKAPPVVACIGPSTSAAARKAGLRVDVEAQVHTVSGLVDSMARYWAARREGPDLA